MLFSTNCDALLSNTAYKLLHKDKQDRKKTVTITKRSGISENAAKQNRYCYCCCPQSLYRVSGIHKKKSVAMAHHPTPLQVHHLSDEPPKGLLKYIKNVIQSKITDTPSTCSSYIVHSQCGIHIYQSSWKKRPYR